LLKFPSMKGWRVSAGVCQFTNELLAVAMVTLSGNFGVMHPVSTAF